ncbi:MAG: DUF371 domain-containing protein [Desulfurococcales archaeon]|nr:DUF371 domain-containing protein [Desulfurococcales archaeon]
MGSVSRLRAAQPWIVVSAVGHSNVRATHKSTFEVTRDDYLTPRGDCIIGIRADKAPKDLPGWFKEEARRGGIIVAVLCSEGICDAIAGKGDPRMTFSDERRMVFRRSDYVGPETVMIRASKAARDIRRDLIEKLKSGAELKVYLTVIPVE